MPESVERPAPERTTTSPSATRAVSASRSVSVGSRAGTGATLTPPWCRAFAPRAAVPDAGSPRRDTSPPTAGQPDPARLRRPRADAGTGRHDGRPIQVPRRVPHHQRGQQVPAVEEDLAVAVATAAAHPPLQPGRARPERMAPSAHPAQGAVAAGPAEQGEGRSRGRTPP